MFVSIRDRGKIIYERSQMQSGQGEQEESRNLNYTFLWRCDEDIVFFIFFVMGNWVKLLKLLNGRVIFIGWSIL